jgi:indolepyruvate ferredoxin oxidoreductase alpha subunit
VAQGAWEAGVRVAASYPGTPATEILESLARYPDVYSEWSVNEKVAGSVPDMDFIPKPQIHIG